MMFGKNFPKHMKLLVRPKFGFDNKTVGQVIDFIIYSGISIVPIPIQMKFEDESDKVFYEVARSTKAYLVTGNIRHFPEEPLVIAPQEFLNKTIHMTR